MTAAKWRFRKMTLAEENYDPMERELFESEPINTRLVREAIQNSLAGIHNPLPAERAARYLDGLADHLTYINLTYINDLDESINDRKPQCNGPG